MIDAGIPQQRLAQLSEHYRRNVPFILINSWHMNEHESAAMWSMYGRTGEAIAVQSTFAKLNHSLSNDVLLGVVRYIDYNVTPIPENTNLWPFIHKRKSFEHEREVRALIADWDGALPYADLRFQIDAVHVSPTSPEWFAELVSSVVKTYGYEFPVVQSSLSEDPFF